MPRHWRYAHEKTADAQATERTKNLLVAAVVALRMTVELVAAETAAPPQSARWPELARLDCFACHHDLQTPSERQVRAGFPGRPALNVGCLPLVRVVAKIAKGAAADKEFDQFLAQFQSAFESSPFGDPGLISPPAAAIGAWCRKIEVRIDSIEFTPVRIRAVLQRIAEQASAEDCDYDSARQLLGAWIVVYGELIQKQKDVTYLSAAQRQKIDSLLEDANRQWPELAAPGPLTISCGAEPPKMRDFKTALDQHFASRVRFDPEWFNGLMSQLASLVRP